ncbi:MAG: long-chain fatty acid--CoA ligase [Deltaproteobacteria bacterium]|nr:long-chain fatty acid--CoA ligase [Deltaproteobacteria bacterium]
MENILQAFLKNAERLGKKPCFRYKEEGIWKDISWQQAGERVFAVARGLLSLGVKKGDKIAIFSKTRAEWTLCDLAILSVGAVTVPIYQSNTGEQAAYILGDSDAVIVIVEDLNQLEKIEQRLSGLSKIQKVILITGQKRGEKITTLTEIEKKGSLTRDDWEKGINTIRSKDLCSLVYTSGTTGPPKGAMLAHRNFVASSEACCRLVSMGTDDVGLLFLPLAHILGRVIQFYQIYQGFVHAYAESVDKLIDNLGETRPHFFVSVPRIFEKVYERVQAQVQAGSPLKKAIFAWAVAVGQQASRRLQAKKRIGPSLFLKRELATLLVFQKMKKRLGGRLRYAISGGAPLSKEIAEFLHAAGILVLEGYGLTETTAANNCNTPDSYKFGTVGRPVYALEEKIAPDGEILIRGDQVFQGYYKNPEASREVLTPDGWFHSGDIGVIDEDGFLTITDRKKDIIVTAGGKNIAPQNLENILKTIPYVSQAMVHGDRRKYLSALITLNQEVVETYARNTGIQFKQFRELTIHPKIYHLIQQAIEDKNKNLASYETIKKFVILESDFTQETGELTPTLKVKRKFVSEKYKEVLAKLYQE